MAYSAVSLPLTGAGDATAAAAADVVGGNAYQAIKLIDGTEGSTVPVPAKGTTPGSTDHGLVVRPIGSTAHIQGVVMSSVQTVTVGNPTTSVNVANPTTSVNIANPTTAVSLSSNPGLTSGSSAVELTSAGSTRLAGRFTVDNPTTAVNVANPTTAVNVANPTTSVSLSSVHTFTVGNPTTAVNVANPTTAVNVANPTTSITLSSQHTVDLSSAGSTRSVGTLNQGSPAGSSADAWWVRTVTTGAAGAGSTVVDITTSTATRMAAAQGPGSSANYWVIQTLGFTSALTSRTSANTSANASVVAASTAVLGMIIQNMTTVDVGLSLSTAAPSTALANIDIILSGRQIAGGGSYVAFGYDLPNFTGNIRGITIGSTTVAGGVVITKFLSS